MNLHITTSFACIWEDFQTIKHQNNLPNQHTMAEYLASIFGTEKDK